VVQPHAAVEEEENPQDEVSVSFSYTPKRDKRHDFSFNK
jgi:hypothetical protein